VIEGFNAAAVYKLPPLSSDDLQKLVDGKVVKIREPAAADEPQRAIGMLLTAHPRDAMWVAARTEEGSYASMSNYLIPGTGDLERWYQHMNVPFPFTDRHWVIDVWDNKAAAEAGLCWEHPWRLAPTGYETARQATADQKVSSLTLKQFDGAVKVPVNNGAWVACELGSETLLVFHAQSVVGGAVPDRLVLDFTMMTLGKVVRGVESRAATAASWYRGGIVGGDGQRIVLSP
jgi:hypothetical protein